MIGSGLLQAAMKDNNKVLLGSYVQAIRERDVPELELRRKYNRLRQRFPHIPSLVELDRRRAAAEHR